MARLWLHISGHHGLANDFIFGLHRSLKSTWWEPRETVDVSWCHPPSLQTKLSVHPLWQRCSLGRVKRSTKLHRLFCCHAWSIFGRERESWSSHLQFNSILKAISIRFDFATSAKDLFFKPCKWIHTCISISFASETANIIMNGIKVIEGNVEKDTKKTHLN